MIHSEPEMPPAAVPVPVRESEAKFRSYIDKSPEGIFVVDEQGRYVEVNIAATRITGYSATELLTMSIADITPDDCIPEAMRNFAAVASSGQSSSEIEFRHKDGSRRWWSIEAVRLSENRFLGFTRDITERKYLENSWRETEKFSRAILNSVGAEIAVIDRHGVITSVNEAWLDFAQKNSLTPGVPAPNTGIGANYLAACKAGSDVEPDEDALNAREGIRAVLNGKLPSYTLDYPCPSPDQPRWFTMSATPLGKVGESVVISHTDITARKLAEDEARKSMRWWQTLYKYSPLPTYVWEEAGPDWKLASYNEAAVVFTSGKISEMIGVHASKFYADEPEIIAAFADCQRFGIVKKGTQPYTMRSTGEIRNLSVTYSFIPEKYILVTVQDETEISKSLTALAESEAHMRLIADAFPGPVSHIDSNGRYSYVNRHYETWFGDKKEDVIGRTPREVLKQELFAKIEPYLQRVLAGEHITWEAELHTADGRRRVGQISHLPDFDSAGKVCGIFTIVSDITKRKQAEEDLRTSLAQKEILLAEVHHRVKNNLQVISSLISMQSRFLKDKSALMHLENLSLRIRSMGLLHTMLYKSGDLGSVPMKLYVAVIAEQVFAVHGRTSKGVEFTADIDEVSLNIETSLPVGLIVNETISNALKHAFEGVANPQIKLSLKNTTGGHVLEIWDNGRGIKKDVNKTLSLGLRLVEILTRQIHGVLTITTDQGTCISIQFHEQTKESERWKTEKS